MTTVIYILLLWFLFNVVFALGTYFRPPRKVPVDASSDLAPVVKEGRDSLVADERPLKSGNAPSSADNLSSNNRQPALLTKVLFFGTWLYERRRSV